MAKGNPSFLNGVPELVVLELLSRGEMYGYELVQAVRATTREAINLGEGVIYPLLHALEKDGALKSRRAPAAGRIRVYYTLTSKGVRRLFDLTDDWGRLNGAVAAVLKGGAHAV